MMIARNGVETSTVAVDEGLLDVFSQIGCAYDMVEHEAVFTIEEALRAVPHIDGIKTKNVFIRDAKGNRHMLVVVSYDKRIDLVELARVLPSTKLSMGSIDRLQKHLGVTPGAVSIFAVVNDPEQKVELIVDEPVWQAAHVQGHPLRNTATVSISHAALEAFLNHVGHAPRVLAVP
jgi:Ala-tRNA(Pro) deacylase